MNPEDAALRSLGHGNQVRVWNERGEVILRLAVTDAVRPGVAAECDAGRRRRLRVSNDLLAISRPIVKPEQAATQLRQSGRRPRFDTVAPPGEAPPCAPGIDVRLT